VFNPLQFHLSAFSLKSRVLIFFRIGSSQVQDESTLHSTTGFEMFERSVYLIGDIVLLAAPAQEWS